LSGGLEVGAIAQFYGGPGTGKTHLCHLLCAVMPTAYGVFYIDTELTFREEKVQSIARARREQWDPHNIHIARPIDSMEQESCIDQLCSSTDLRQVKLVIIDSMTYHYKAEYAKHSNLAKRAAKLVIYMHNLRRLTIRNKIAVVITNHSTSDPRSESRSRPFGGNIMSHTSDYIINFTHRAKTLRNINAMLTQSPIKGPQSVQLM
jgi:DNA repair protein RadA